MRINPTPLLLLLGAASAHGATAAVAPAKDASCACCKAEGAPATPGAYTRNSIYQLDASFTDDSGRPFALGDLRGRPVVLTMFFASCGYACPLQVTDMQRIRAKLPPGVADRTAFVLVSFDVARDTPPSLAQYRIQRSLDAQWRLLHGDNDGIRELAALLGVKYRQEADGAFSHSNVMTVLDPRGEIAYQRLGLNGGIDETVAALVAASK
jgi:protein SCO1/2